MCFEDKEIVQPVRVVHEFCKLEEPTSLIYSPYPHLILPLYSIHLKT